MSDEEIDSNFDSRQWQISGDLCEYLHLLINLMSITLIQEISRSLFLMSWSILLTYITEGSTTVLINLIFWNISYKCCIKTTLTCTVQIVIHYVSQTRKTRVWSEFPFLSLGMVLILSLLLMCEKSKFSSFLLWSLNSWGNFLLLHGVASLWNFSIFKIMRSRPTVMQPSFRWNKTTKSLTMWTSVLLAYDPYMR